MIIQPNKIFIQFIFTFMVLSVIPALYLYHEYSRIRAEQVKELQAQNQHHIDFTIRTLHALTNDVSQSIAHIAQTHSLKQALKHPTHDNQSALRDMLQLILNKHYYSQLQLVDPLGNETFNLTYQNKHTTNIAKPQLTNVSERGYFQYAQIMPPNSIDSYGIVLEYQDGEMILPLKPTLHIIASVYENDKPLGYFVASLSLHTIFNQIQLENTFLNNPQIINSDGYVLMANNLERAFGHIISERKNMTLKLQNPALWALMQQQDKGRYFDGNKWYMFSKLDAELPGLPNNNFLLLSTENNHLLIKNQRQMNGFIENIVLIVITITCISGIFTTWTALHQKNSLESKIAQAAMDGMSALVITNRDNKIIKVNNEFSTLTGYTLEDVQGQNPSILSSKQHSAEFFDTMWQALNANQPWENEIINKSKDGSLITLILRVQPIMDKNQINQYYVASFVDITERKSLEMSLRNLSEQDPLTNLWNRRKFDQLLHDEVELVKRYPTKVASCLTIFDIDDFKSINDTYGHDMGDKVIKQVADELSKGCRHTDSVTRIGGEEFAIILRHTTLEDAFNVLNRLRENVALHSQLHVTVSGGLTHIGQSSDIGYKQADIALYHSKNNGKNQISIYNQALGSEKLS